MVAVTTERGYGTHPGYYVFSGMLALFGGALSAWLGYMINGFFWQTLLICIGMGIIGYGIFLIFDCRIIANNPPKKKKESNDEMQDIFYDNYQGENF